MADINPETQGKKLWHRLIERNIDHGGILGEITGAQGTSKTATLLFLADFIMKYRPYEKIFFREQIDAPLQIFKIGNSNKYNFFVKSDAEIVFRDRNNKLSPINLQHKVFDTYADLYEMAQPNKVSVVFFKSDTEWMEFIEYLRNVGEWVNILIDEMADVTPEGAGGKEFKRVEKFSTTMGAVRRCMMNLMYNTQSVADVHWKIRHKVMMHVYFRGARRDNQSRIKQKFIDTLDVNERKGNEAWIESMGTFGKIRFSSIYTVNPKKHIEAHRIEQDTTET